jgi:UDP-2,3-diacylglucosamine hydrolase
MTSKIGIIAGGGQFPLLFARAAKEEGREVVVVAHEGESRPDLATAADRLYWIKLGQLGKIISYFKKEKVSEAVFLGTITKTNIFRDIRPDWRGLSLWRKIDIRHDDSILRAIADELEKEGILVRESTLYLGKLLFPKGVLTRKAASASQLEDVRFGWRIARAVGGLDIGQCVVVRDRTVLAVEAIEGTDAAIRRGGSLAGEQAVVVKVKKPNQDYRFDLPAIGLQTIATMEESKASLLAVESGQALLFDGEEVVRRADAAGITIIGIEELADGSLSSS